MSEDPIIRSLLSTFLEQLSRWRSARRTGADDEDDMGRRLIDAWDDLTDAVENEPRDGDEREPSYRTELLNDGRGAVIYRDGREIGTSELVGEAEWIAEDSL